MMKDPRNWNDYAMGDPNEENNFIGDPDDYITPEDAIGMEISEGERIQYGSTFSPQDGDIGDESEDLLDMPKALRETGHRYDPTLSTGQVKQSESNEITNSMHLADEDDIGMAYGEDDYIED